MHNSWNLCPPPLTKSANVVHQQRLHKSSLNSILIPCVLNLYSHTFHIHIKWNKLQDVCISLSHTINWNYTGQATIIVPSNKCKALKICLKITKNQCNIHLTCKLPASIYLTHLLSGWWWVTTTSKFTHKKKNHTVKSHY